MSRCVVASHDRSGTHLVISLVAAAMGGCRSWVDLPLLGGEATEWLGYSGVPPARLVDEIKHVVGFNTGAVFKTHHDATIWPAIAKEKVVYALRGLEDTLLSCWVFFHRRGMCHNVSPEEFCFDMEPDDVWFPGAYTMEPRPRSFVERWNRHVDGWLNTGAHVIRYEQLLTDHERVTAGLRQYLTGDRSPVHMPLHPVGIDPWQARAGVAQKFFTPSLLDRLREAAIF